MVKAADSTPLVTLNQIIPVYVTFSVPEQNVSEIRTYLAKGEIKVQARLPNSTVIPTGGRISFLDNSADTTTGTIKLRAEFPNADRALWPGQFVNVAVTLYEQNDAVVAPSASVQSGPTGQYVYVVKSDLTVELRAIEVSRVEGDDTVIASGLAPGERVVTVGSCGCPPAPRSRSAATPAHREHLRTVHPPAGDDDAGDDRHPRVRHRSPTGCCRCSDLPNVDFPTIQVQAQLPGAESGDDGLGGRDAAGEAVLDDRRPRLDDLASSAHGHHPDHAAVRARPQHRRAPRRTCRRRSPPRRASCRRRCRRRRRSSKVNPADAPILLHRAVVADAAAVDGRRVRARRCSRSASRRCSGVAQVRSSARRNTRCACSSIRARWPSAASASTKSQAAIGSSNVNLPDRHALRPRPARTPVQANGQLTNAADYRPHDRRLPQRRAGAPGRARARDRQRAERQGRQLVQRHARRSCSAVQRQPGTNTVEVVDAIKKLLPTLRAAAAGRGEARRCSTTARSRSATRCTTCRSRCCWRWCWSCW